MPPPRQNTNDPFANLNSDLKNLAAHLETLMINIAQVDSEQENTVNIYLSEVQHVHQRFNDIIELSKQLKRDLNTHTENR